MAVNFKIHFEWIDGFVNVDNEFKNKIKRKILFISPVYKFAKKVGITSVHIGYFLNRSNAFISIKNLIKILKSSKINLRIAEKHIIGYRDANSTAIYKIKFPYYYTPVDMRIISVLVGDGYIHHKNKSLRWIQNDTNPLRELLFSRFNYFKLGKTKSTQIVIPAFFRKISCYALNLEPNELKTYKIIQRSFNLPTEYKLALLVAVIEDEANIDPKNYSGINLRMSDERIISSLKKLCDLLNYKTSHVIKYKNRGTYGENEMYKLNILSEGITKFGYDILDFEKKFGKNTSLWKKRADLLKRWEICIGKKAQKNKEGLRLHKEIIDIFKKDQTLSLTEISSKIEIDKVRVSWILKNMYKRGEIRRIKRGTYKYDGVYMSKKL